MSGTDHPPSTAGSPSLARRALTTTAAALAAVALPVGIVATTAGGSERAAVASGETSTSFLGPELVRALRESDPVRFEAAPTSESTTTTATPTTTTTTTAPPPPPTTTTSAPPAPPPPPAPEPAAATGASGYADPSNPAAWDRLAQCESGGNWHIDTGNGYYGGLQFSLSSWQAVGGTGYPHEHSRETQITMGQRLHAQGGWGHWPGCARKLGYM